MSRRHRVLIAGLATLLVIADFVRIDVASHSVSDTLINWVPQVGVIALLAVALLALDKRIGGRGPG
jgi:hypothetical protein